MAINIEVKYRFKELEERISILEKRLSETTIAAPVVTKEPEQQKVKLCPHCGEKPAYFFHTRSCLKKNKNNADRNRDQSDA